MRLMPTLCAAAVSLTVLPAPTFAQDTTWVVPYSLQQIEAYYALYGPSRLVQAQVILREGGRYSGPLDGQWGQGTADAFALVIETQLAIGGAEFAVVARPDAVPGVTDWIGAVILAEGGYGDLPD